MKPLRRLLAAALLLAALPAHAAHPDACFASAGGGTSAGTVESVREVPVSRDLHAFDPEILEHRQRPETGEELVVRLDEGPLVVLTLPRPQQLQAGERVRVTCAPPYADSLSLLSGAQREF